MDKLVRTALAVDRTRNAFLRHRFVCFLWSQELLRLGSDSSKTVLLEEPWKLLKGLGSFKAKDVLLWWVGGRIWS